MKIVKQKCLKAYKSLAIRILYDSQHPINRFKALDYKASQALKAQIYQIIEQLTQQELKFFVC